MTRPLDNEATRLTKKRKDAARRRLHRRLAHEALVNEGIPKGVTMAKLIRSHAAMVGNERRQRRVSRDVRARRFRDGRQIHARVRNGRCNAGQ